MGAIAGKSGDARADGTRRTTVEMYPVTPPQRHKPMMPAEQAGLAVDPAVVTVKGSLVPTAASIRPGPVATAAGEGGDAAPAGAQENWVQRCLVNPPRQQTPAVPAKQASLVIESTATTVRGSLGLASLGPGPFATAAGEGGGAAAAGAQESWVWMCLVTPQRRHTPVFPAKQASLAMESTVTTVRGSLGLASLGAGPVVTAAGKGGGAAAARAQESWVRRCLVALLWQGKLILGLRTVQPRMSS